MKSLLYLSLLLQLLIYLHIVRAGPIVISNSDDVLDDIEIDDEFTTQTVERLSSAATCLVASVEYTHGQQIYRADPCEFCLCLDGEMFCWWQDCPPALEGPCKDKRPFTSCQAPDSNTIMGGPASAAAAELSQPQQPRREAPPSPTTLPSPQTTPKRGNNTAAGGNAQVSPVVMTAGRAGTASAGTASVMDVTTVTPKRCSIMGRSYNIGDRLPHTTGNCVECVCGAGAQIVCSPHQCAPSVDDINDYRPEGLRSGQPDVF